MATAEKQEEVQRIAEFAETLYCQSPDWITFYREILGLHGVVRHAFPSRHALEEFEQTDTYREIQRMLARLRKQGPLANDPNEPTQVITVRLPKSLHDALRVEAHEHQTSMNKLCISKLLKFIENHVVPGGT
jgi:predicted HicB family RNase H-like nuclease